MTPRPGPLQVVNLLLLLFVALLLFAPLLGLGKPPLVLVLVLLAVRLGLQVVRARREPHLRRPGAWLLDLVLIALLLTQGRD